MFKKIAVIAAAAALFAGCTTIESTQKFNAVNLGNSEEKAVCQTFVEMTGYYFLGLQNGRYICGAYCRHSSHSQRW